MYKMIAKENKLYLLLFIFNVIYHCDGLVEFQKTDLTKVLQSIDAASSDTHLFDVTLKLLQSVCACMHETLHKDHQIFIDEANSLHLEEDTDHENDLNLYKQIYNSTCIHLRHELVNKFRRHELSDDDDDTNQEGNALTKYQNHYLEENVKAVMKRTIFASLIKKRDIKIYKIEKHNLFSNKLLLGDNNENRVIIIITLYPFLNKTVDKIKIREVTEKEIKETLLKDTPIDIDIINTADMPDFKKNYRAVIAKKCDLYSIYLFILQSLKRNTIKTFKFLRRKGTIKIYIDASANIDVENVHNLCCENNTLLTECKKLIFEEHDVVENFVQNKTDKNKLESYKDIVSKIKLLIKQFSNKTNNNQRFIRSSKLLLVTNPITDYKADNKSNKILATTPPGYHITITSSYNNLQLLHSTELITPTNIMKKQSDEYILSNKSSSLSNPSNINNNTATNETSNSVATLFSGVRLDHLPPNDDNMKYRNLITNNELVKKQTMVSPDAKTKLISPMNFVFNSRRSQQYNKSLTQTLDYPLTSMTFYKQRHNRKDIAISTPPYMDTSVLKILFSQVTENGTSITPMNNFTEESITKDQSNSSFAYTNDSYNNQYFLEILQNTIKKSTKFNSEETHSILIQNNTSQSNIFENFGLSTNNHRSVLRFKDNNINLFTSSLYDDYVKTSTEVVKINTLLKDKSTSLEKPQIVTQSYTLNEKNYLQEKQNKLQTILENLKQKKELSSTIENIGAFDSNNKIYVSNTNKEVSVILSKVETKPDKPANVAHLQKENGHVTSDQSKRYNQISPLHFNIDQGKQKSSNDNLTSTATYVSNEPNNDTVQRYDSNFINIITSPATLTFQAVKTLETNLPPPIMLKNNNKLYRQTTLSQPKPLKLKPISEEQQNIKQKDFNNVLLHKINLVNNYDNFINESVNKAYFTSNRTIKIEVLSGKDNSVKSFKRKSEFFPHLSNNNEASSENVTLTKDINIQSNDLDNYVTLSPNKLDADLTKERIHKNTRTNLVPDLTTLLGSNIYNKVTTPHRNDGKSFTHEIYTLHYLIPKPANTYIRNKNKKLQHFETNMSSRNEITYFKKYQEKKLQLLPFFLEKISGGTKKIKLDNANATKPGNFIDSPNFQVTESIKGITVARTHNKGYINKEDVNLLLPSLITTKLKPLSDSKLKNMHHLSILNIEDIPKLKENDTLSWKNEVILEQSSTAHPENTISIFSQSDPHASEDRSKAFNYFKHKNIGKLLSKHISVKYDFLKDVLNISNTKVPVHTTDIFSMKRSQNKQRRQDNNYENKEIDRNKNTFSLSERNDKNESNITNLTISLTTKKVFTKLITNNKIAVTKNTIPKPQISLKINGSSNIFKNNNKMFTINEVTYAPNIGKTKLFDSITSSILHVSHVAKRPTQYPKFNTSKSSTNITIKNISYKEIDEEVKRVTSTKWKEENKKYTLSNKLGMTNSLDNNIVILSTENTNVLTYSNATKGLIFVNKKLLPDEKHFKPKTMPIKLSESDVTLNIYDHLQFNKQYQYVSKKKNLTEKNEMSQTVKNMTYLLWPTKYSNQNLTKNNPNLTTSSKKFKKPSTKSGLKEKMYKTSSIKPQMNMVFIDTESTNNFTKQTQINTLETSTLRYNNGHLNAANKIGINLKKINFKPEKKRVIDHPLKTFNETTILHLLYKDLTLMHDTRSYTSDYKNSATNQNVSTIRTVNSITANNQKYEDALFKKGQNLKLYKEMEKLKTPILEMSISQTISPPIKDNTIKRITDYKLITSTENYQTLKSINKTRKMTTSLHILLTKYQNNNIKKRLKANKSYSLNKALKSENHKVYITTPVYATNIMQNKTNYIPKTYLNNDLKRIIVTPEIYIKSGQNQKYKSGKVIKKNNTVYHTNESGVTNTPTTVNQLEIQNVQSPIPILLKTHTNITCLYFGNYSQYGSNGPNMTIIRIPKDLSIKDHEKSGILYNGTDIPDKELKLHTYNRNISTVSKVFSKSIGNDTENEVQQEMKNVLKVKQQYQNKKTFIHTKYVPLIASTTESYSSKDFNIERRFHLNNNLTSSVYPSQQYVPKKLLKTDLRYNNIASEGFPEIKDKNKNQINDTILLNLNNGSNTNYDLVIFPQRKYTSDADDINDSAVMKSTSEKKLQDENIMNEYMTKRLALDTMPWDIIINKSIGINHPQIATSYQKQNKRVEFFKSKSTSTVADTTYMTSDVISTSDMSHLNNTQLNSIFSSFVPYFNSYTLKYFPSSHTAIENQIRATLPIDHKYKMAGQTYYTTISPLTIMITRFGVPKINTTTTPTFEDKGSTTRSLFIIHYDNTTSSITKNLYKNEHLYTTNEVSDISERSFFSKDRTTRIFDLGAGKLQEHDLNKKMFFPNKRNKMVLDPLNIKVTNKTAFHSNILKNINDLYNGNGSKDPGNIKIQINNNFKIKTLTYQKVYIKNDYKLSTTMRRFKKSKTIKYNTYQPTNRNLDITQSMPDNINFNERDKQTNKPKDSFLYTRISIIPTNFIFDSKLKLSKITNRSNGQRPKSKVSNKELAYVNKNSLLHPFDKTNPYPVKKLPRNIQRKILRRIHFPNKDRELIAKDTKDFFQLPAIPNNNYFRKPSIPYLRNQIEKPVKFKPKQFIISPIFAKIYDSNLKYKHFRPKPLLIDNNDFYREELQNNHRRNALLLRKEVNYIRDAPPPPIGKSKVSHVIERPPYLPPNTKPRFLRDRIDFIRNYMKSADFIKSTEFPIKHYVEEATDVAGLPYEDPLYFFRKSGWYDTKISDDSITSTTAPKRTVTDWWLDDMYLKIRLPVPINSNPGMVFPRKQFSKIDEVADLAALYIDDLLDYKEMLDRGELPQERATSREKGQPLCMEQFYRLLGVCRIPEVGKDRLELPSRPSDPYECEELIIVACRNYFYPIPVKASDRGRLNPGEIQAQLLHAMVDAAGAPPAPKIGLLTSMNRDQWAKAREQLIKDDTNRCNFDLISRALCVLCVDEAGGDRPGVDPDTNALLRAMHGAGTAYHSANRWFDKTVQLIISSDGTVGMCYEHSPAEGVAVVRLAERALARADVAPRPAPPPALLPAPAALRWTLTGDTPRTIERAGRELDRAISDLDMKVYTYRGYGREFMKTCRTSPDVYIQLALQYAYYKMYGYLVSTYESASLRRFHNGRVDNIRSAHSAAKAWASAMTAADAPHDEEGGRKVSFNLYGEQKRLELFEEAARKQTSIMEANIQGRGMDNHLLGLREAAREALGSLPDLFTDQTYTRMIEFRLSTSQVATTTEGTFMGYGAVVPDGYGCSYNPKHDCVIFCISSFVSSSVTNTEAFRQALEEALDSMKLMFQNKKVEG